MSRRNKRKKIGKTGCLFWLIILLILIIILLYKGKDSIKDTISFIKNMTSKEETAKISQNKRQNKSETETNNQKSIKKEKIEENKNIKSQKETLKEQTAKNNVIASKSKQKTEKKKEIKYKEFFTPVYFIKIEIDGNAKPIPIKRKVRYYDSPITRTYETLLKGPAPAERKRGIISFIPKGTKLISASIKNGTLILNFNEKLEENYSGREAITLEILQILYTAFEFDKVKKVKILINGKRKQYITGEGIPLKSYYTREDLSRLQNFLG